MFLCTLRNVQCTDMRSVINYLYDHYHKMSGDSCSLWSINTFSVGFKKQQGEALMNTDGVPCLFSNERTISFFTFLTLVIQREHCIHKSSVLGFESALSLLRLKGPNYLRSWKIVYFCNSFIKLCTPSTIILHFGIFLTWLCTDMSGFFHLHE